MVQEDNSHWTPVTVIKVSLAPVKKMEVLMGETVHSRECRIPKTPRKPHLGTRKSSLEETLHGSKELLAAALKAVEGFNPSPPRATDPTTIAPGLTRQQEQRLNDWTCEISLYTGKSCLNSF